MLNIEQLKTLTDKQLIENIKTKGCDDSTTVLMTRHSGIWHQTVRTYVAAAKNYSGCLSETICDSKNYVFMMAVNNYDETRGANFCTYFANWIRWNSCNLINDEKLQYIPIENVNNNSCFTYKASKEYNEEIKYVFDVLEAHPNSNMKEIFRLRFFESLTLEEIGEKFNLTYERIRQILESGLEFLRKRLKTDEHFISSCT